ncbi:Peptidyl-prolyl cis-trans isomerase D [Durusdinium trenchii]|uniref:Peptidyl-prolyl cis-trans isomerase D n=1 Tax=Durusdinium trenchii TaxID=1381693 RepID=A0ABP0LW75_9DINO
MSLFSGDNEIGNILQQAVKLKTAQMNDKRKTYETLDRVQRLKPESSPKQCCQVSN